MPVSNTPLLKSDPPVSIEEAQDLESALESAWLRSIKELELAPTRQSDHNVDPAVDGVQESLHKAPLYSRNTRGLFLEDAARMISQYLQDQSPDFIDTFMLGLLIIAAGFVVQPTFENAQNAMSRGFDTWYEGVSSKIINFHQSQLPLSRGRHHEDIRAQILYLIYQLHSVISRGSSSSLSGLEPLATFTPRENVTLYAYICDVAETDSHREFDILTLAEVEDVVSRSRLFRDIAQRRNDSGQQAIDVVNVILMIRKHLSIIHESSDLPLELANELGYEEVKRFLQYRSVASGAEIPSANEHSNHLQSQVYSGWKPADDILALLAMDRKFEERTRRAISAWAALPDGLDLHRRLVAEVHTSNNPFRLTLLLAALYSFAKFHPYDDSFTPFPLTDDPVSDFRRLPGSKSWPSSNMVLFWGPIISCFITIMMAMEVEEYRQAVKHILGDRFPYHKDRTGWFESYWVTRLWPSSRVS